MSLLQYFSKAKRKKVDVVESSDSETVGPGDSESESGAQIPSPSIPSQVSAAQSPVTCILLILLALNTSLVSDIYSQTITLIIA